MKKLLIGTVIGLGLLLGGCGMVDTAQERWYRTKHIYELQARMLVDDWDKFWMHERSSRLTQWQTTIGH